MPPPHLRTRWSIRAPSEDTNHVLVSQACSNPSARSAPAWCEAEVAPASRSPFVASDTSNGSTSTGLAHDATVGSTGTRSAAGPGTRLLACAMAAARAPAARASASVRSGTPKKPQEEPTRARTPTPIVSAWLRSSMSPLRAAMDSYLVCTTRASAYRAPAPSAASTAAVAASKAAGEGPGAAPAGGPEDGVMAATLSTTADSGARRPQPPSTSRPRRSPGGRVQGMPQATDTTERDELIDRATDAAERSGHRHERLRGFLARYYRHVPVEDLAEREPLDLAGAALSHRQLAAQRPQGTANVRVFTPTVDEYGWTSGHTVVEIVTDDMPFLVDSVTAELSRQDRGIHLLVHPQVVVRRDVTGRLLEVLDESAGAWSRSVHPRDSLVESWIHVEIDRETDRERLAAVQQDLLSVLDDVRVAVEDWPKMKQRARDIAAELAAAPPPGLPADEVEEGRELLAWLAADHFTFLGYRDYRLVERDGRDTLVAVTGSGLGILRYDQPVSSGSFDRLTPQARAKAREKRLLVLTTANTRATVHRAAYLAYVSVKQFDTDGEVVGERRFLGLFASSAYTDSVQRIPVVRRKVHAVLDRSGFAPDSHSGKDLLQILETYPRDELFEISVDDLYPTVIAVMHLQERRRTRLFLRPDAYGRYVSCLVFLPRDRYTTSVRLRMEEILREAYHGGTVDYSTRVSESVLARLHFVVRLPAGTELPQVDREDLEAELVEATRSWDEDLGDALRSELGEEEAARLLRCWGNGFPEAYKEDFPARVAV